MIKFGTSGWRGLIARDFTFDNVRLATQAIADYLASPLVPRPSSLVIVGYDTRFLGREFALAAAEVLANNGLVPLLCNRDTPTPVIAHTIRARVCSCHRLFCFPVAALFAGVDGTSARVFLLALLPAVFPLVRRYTTSLLLGFLR